MKSSVGLKIYAGTWAILEVEFTSRAHPCIRCKHTHAGGGYDVGNHGKGR